MKTTMQITADWRKREMNVRNTSYQMVRWFLLCTKMESGAICGIALIQGFVGQESFDFPVMWPGLASIALGSSNIVFEARNQVRWQPFSGLFQEKGITCMQTPSTDVELKKSPWPLEDEQNFCPRTILKWNKGKKNVWPNGFRMDCVPFSTKPFRKRRESRNNFSPWKFFQLIEANWPVSFRTFAIQSFSPWKI